MGAVEEIVELDAELRGMPGSDGDSKLEIWVDLTEGFQEPSGVIATLAEGGVKVNATASEKVSRGAKTTESTELVSLCALLTGTLTRTHRLDRKER